MYATSYCLHGPHARTGAASLSLALDPWSVLKILAEEFTRFALPRLVTCIDAARTFQRKSVR